MDFEAEFDRSLEAVFRPAADLRSVDAPTYCVGGPGNTPHVVAQTRDGARPFRISSNVGEPVPIPWTASGRLLVSHLSDAEIQALIPDEDFRLPDGRLRSDFTARHIAAFCPQG